MSTLDDLVRLRRFYAEVSGQLGEPAAESAAMMAEVAERGDPEAAFGLESIVLRLQAVGRINLEKGPHRLSATGYRMDQRLSLRPQEEFVFGYFTATRLGVAAQVPIREIELDACKDFDPLAALDPLAAQESAGGSMAQPLTRRDQIRYV